MSTLHHSHTGESGKDSRLEHCYVFGQIGFYWEPDAKKAKMWILCHEPKLRKNTR